MKMRMVEKTFVSNTLCDPVPSSLHNATIGMTRIRTLRKLAEIHM